MSKLTHYMQHGHCVECRSDRESVEAYTAGNEVFVDLEPGSLVYWSISLPGVGPIDETFAPDQDEARKWAIAQHGKGARVRLLVDRLTLASPEEAPAPAEPLSLVDQLKRELGKGNSSSEEWVRLRSSLVRDVVRELDARAAQITKLEDEIRYLAGADE